MIEYSALNLKYQLNFVNADLNQRVHEAISVNLNLSVNLLFFLSQLNPSL